LIKKLAELAVPTFRNGFKPRKAGAKIIIVMELRNGKGIFYGAVDGRRITAGGNGIIDD
jgi:hypothetical protein